METIQILIQGYVQGVYFRDFIKERAKELKLTGYVKNRDRDKIEAKVEGHEAKLKKFLEIIKQGPPGAEIKEFKVAKQPYKNEFKGFSIKY